MKKYFGLLAAAALLVACTDPIENENSSSNGSVEGTLTISASTRLIQANGTDSAIITVKLDGEEITEGVTIYDADTDAVVKLTNSAFTTTEAGTYSFYAAYKTLVTATGADATVIAVDFAIPDVAEDPQPESTSFHKNLFLVQFTGTSCGYCPGMVDLLDDLAEDDEYNSKYYRAAVHSYGTSDAAYLSNGSSIANAFGVSSWPTVVMDMYASTSNYSSLSSFKTLFNTAYDRANVQAGISANCEYDDNVIVVTVGVKAAVSGTYRVGLWVLEDGIYSSQERYSTAGTSGKDYNTHNDCVRLVDCRNEETSGYDYTGKTLGSLAIGASDKYAFSVDIASKWDMLNVHLIAFVSYKTSSGYSCANCIDFRPGETVTYQYE